MKVLFSPLGLSPGSLFTAIVHTKPDRVVVVSSREGAKFVPEIVNKAEEAIDKKLAVEVHTVSDPFTGFHDGRRLAKSLVGLSGDENIANIAGGTTVLQDAVQHLARLIGAREVAVVDRRPPDEQKRNPYVVGELIEVPAE